MGLTPANTTEGRLVSEPERPVLILTPEQFSEGYLVRTGATPTATRHPFKVVARRSDGNYIVLDPRPEDYAVTVIRPSDPLRDRPVPINDERN